MCGICEGTINSRNAEFAVAAVVDTKDCPL